MSTTGYDALYETLKANADSLPLRYRRRTLSNCVKLVMSGDKKQSFYAFLSDGVDVARHRFKKQMALC
ncbi:hypothetical protein [Nostoc flagelliforme]|uniref:hypothetical protein n=1 Tax=Nostoc flagelliforme TaxID=1306274 RepID=UPI0012FDA41A|nr:hypothetical protein [Nostoc flagelliforme]